MTMYALSLEDVIALAKYGADAIRRERKAGMQHPLLPVCGWHLPTAQDLDAAHAEIQRLMGEYKIVAHCKIEG